MDPTDEIEITEEVEVEGGDGLSGGFFLGDPDRVDYETVLAREALSRGISPHEVAAEWGGAEASAPAISEGRGWSRRMILITVGALSGALGLGLIGSDSYFNGGIVSPAAATNGMPVAKPAVAPPSNADSSSSKREPDLRPDCSIVAGMKDGFAGIRAVCQASARASSATVAYRGKPASGQVLIDTTLVIDGATYFCPTAVRKPAPAEYVAGTTLPNLAEGSDGKFQCFKK